MVESYALIVPLQRGQEARELVASLGIGRADLKLGRRDGRLVIPIREPVEPPFPEATVEMAEFEETRGSGSYKAHAQVPDELRRILPSSFDIVGDLVLIKTPEPLRAYGKEIGRAILAAHPQIRGVFHDAGVSGPTRVRAVVPLAGVDRTDTVHSEYGAKFRVDVAGAYFSPRLANEHHRIAQAVQPGEVFVDATCGVGPFAVLAARRGVAKKIFAIDVNPRAIQLLRENLAQNRVEARVEVITGDALDAIAYGPDFDRCVVNLPHAGEPILAAAWRKIRSGGTVHYFTISTETGHAEDAGALAEKLGAALGRTGKVLGTRVVHPYSPVDRLVSMDFQVA